MQTHEEIAQACKTTKKTVQRWIKYNLTIDNLICHMGVGDGNPKKKEKRKKWEAKIVKEQKNENFSLRQFEKKHKKRCGLSHSFVHRILKENSLFRYKHKKIGAFNDFHASVRLTFCKNIARFLLQWWEKSTCDRFKKCLN